MTIYIITTIITISVALFVNNRYEYIPYQPQRQKMSNGILLGTIFIILFSVSACRIAVGNDYWEYTEIFYFISVDRHVSTEIGFNLVVKFMQLLFGTGQISYLCIFALIAIPTIYYMIKGIYDQCDHFPYGFFLLMMGGYYFSSLNSIRYYLVLAVSFYAGKYVIQKKWGQFLLCIITASLFHKSVLIVIPLYWLASRQWKKKTIIFGVIGCLSLVLFPEFYRKLMFLFYPYYENSVFDTGSTSLTNIARCGGILIFSLLYYKQAIQNNMQNKFYFMMNIGALILYTCCSFIPEVSRIGFYLNISNIILIPNILVTIPNKKQKIFWSISIGGAFFVYFTMFLYKAMDVSIRLVPYISWVFD